MENAELLAYGGSSTGDFEPPTTTKSMMGHETYLLEFCTEFGSATVTELDWNASLWCVCPILAL